MPTEQGVELDEESMPPCPGGQLGEARKERSIRRSESGAGHLPSENGNLLTEHDHLDRQITAVAPIRGEQLEDPCEAEVEKRQSHGTVSCFSPICEGPDQSARMTFSALTCRRQGLRSGHSRQDLVALYGTRMSSNSGVLPAVRRDAFRLVKGKPKAQRGNEAERPFGRRKDSSPGSRGTPATARVNCANSAMAADLLCTPNLR